MPPDPDPREAANLFLSYAVPDKYLIADLLNPPCPMAFIPRPILRVLGPRGPWALMGQQNTQELAQAPTGIHTRRAARECVLVKQEAS